MALILDGVSHGFGRHAALREVTLRVEPGDCYGFIGHNGAGKTTAMRVALGLLRPDAGRVLIDGLDARRHPAEARARTRGLIEAPGFHGGWSGRRNLRAYARLAGMGAREARDEAQSWFARVGLEHAGDKAVRTYSQGMKQRLGIAQALLGRPRYVILDEPTNGLDPEGLAEMRALLLELRREDGMTVLVSSHQLHELSGVCNRVGVLREGRLLVEGDLKSLLRRGAPHRLEARHEAAASAALESLGLAAERVGEGRWQLDLEERDSAEVLRHLAASDAEVTGFAREEPSLEELYLSCAEGRVPEAEAAASTTEPATSERLAPGAALWRVYRWDLGRVRSLWTLIVLFAGPGALAILAILARWREHETNLDDVTSGELASTTSVTAWEGFGIGLEAGMPFLVFLAAGLASQAIASERAEGTLRYLLMRPMRRIHLVLGKMLAMASLLLAGLAVLVLVSLAAAAQVFDFGGIVEILPNGEPFVLPGTDDFGAEGRTMIERLVFPLLAYVGIGLLAGAIVRRAAAGLGLALLLTAALDVGRIVARGFGAEGWMPSSHAPSALADTSYVSFYLDLVRGYGNTADRFAEQAWTAPIAWLLVSLALAIWITGRRSA